MFSECAAYATYVARTRLAEASRPSQLHGTNLGGRMHLVARYFIGAGVAISIAAIVFSSASPVPAPASAADSLAATEGRRERVASESGERARRNRPLEQPGGAISEPARSDVLRGLIGLLLLQSK